MLNGAGYDAFNTHQSGLKLYVMLVIACNRLMPHAPYKAYRYLLLQFYRLMTGAKADKTKWNAFKQAELSETKLESENLDVCPCCRRQWPEVKS